ncbi:hypothetical protein K7432_014194 [Basidiobolus ranarum]|uniref:Rab-GAP TBC domain-containing protein n=1 Tax=Basidiobolus ranarum TaxID=34480 RepID=A0ABR2VPS7_9FUNG
MAEELRQFAMEGGIGTCVAEEDASKSAKNTLPFYTGDIIVILNHIKEDIYQGYCDDKIGHFSIDSVHIIYLNVVGTPVRRRDTLYNDVKGIGRRAKAKGRDNSMLLDTENQAVDLRKLTLIDNSEETSNTITNVGSNGEHKENRPFPIDLDSFDTNTTKSTTKSATTPLEIDPQYNTSTSQIQAPNDSYDGVTILLTPSDEVGVTDVPDHSFKEEYDDTSKESSLPNNEGETSSLNSGSASSLPRTVSKSSAFGDDPEEQYEMDHSNTGSTNQHLTVDNYGFLCDASDSESFISIQDLGAQHSRLGRVLGLHKDKEAKWIEILSGYNVDYVKHSTRVKRLVGYGIPDSLRGQVWQYLADSHAYRQPGLYQELLSKERLEIYDVIEKDIQRCYPDNIMFYEANGDGQVNLYDVLKAYAQYNPEVGYCQGMGRLVGMMLMQNITPEDTFWLLVATIDKYLSGYYTPTLSKLRIHAAVFDRLLLIHNPKLHRKLASNDVVPLMYMTQWFLTVYTMTLPWSTVLHVWDLLFLRGVKVLFRIGLAILDCCKDHLLNHCPSNTEILSFLLHIPHELLQPNTILEASRKVNLKTSDIEKLSKKAEELGLADRGPTRDTKKLRKKGLI